MEIVYRGPEEAVIINDERVAELAVRGQTITVPDDLGASLLEQSDIWAVPGRTKTKE